MVWHVCLIVFFKVIFGSFVSNLIPSPLMVKDNSGAQKTSCQNGAEAPTQLPQDKVMAAFRAGLSAASTKAKLFADHEEREIQRLSANIVNHQVY